MYWYNFLRFMGILEIFGHPRELKFILLVLAEVETSFSNYKNTFSDNSWKFLIKNSEIHLIIESFSKQMIKTDVILSDVTTVL